MTPLSLQPWTRPSHLAYVWRVLMGVVSLWAIGGIVSSFFGPRWPEGRDAWFDFALVLFIVTFLSIKAFLMWSRTKVWQRLGASLIAVNIAFAMLYLVAITYALWPSLYAPGSSSGT